MIKIAMEIKRGFNLHSTHGAKNSTLSFVDLKSVHSCPRVQDNETVHEPSFCWCLFKLY